VHISPIQGRGSTQTTQNYIGFKMNIEDITKLKLNKLIDSYQILQFPELLKGLRVAYGRSRRNVCHDLRFSEMRMFCLENGTFRRPILQDEIEMISKYYNFDSYLMKEKADQFINKRPW